MPLRLGFFPSKARRRICYLIFWLIFAVTCLTKVDSETQTTNHACRSFGVKTIRFDEYGTAVFHPERGTGQRNLCPELCCKQEWCNHAVLLRRKCYGYISCVQDVQRENSSTCGRILLGTNQEGKFGFHRERTPGERRDWRDIKDTSKTSISAVEQHDASRRVSRETPIRHRRGRKERILRKNLEKVRFIKVKEIHPDAPLPHLARKQSTRFNISEKNPEKLHERKHHQTGRNATVLDKIVNDVNKILRILDRETENWQSNGTKQSLKARTQNATSSIGTEGSFKAKTKTTARHFDSSKLSEIKPKDYKALVNNNRGRKNHQDFLQTFFNENSKFDGGKNGGKLRVGHLSSDEESQRFKHAGKRTPGELTDYDGLNGLEDDVEDEVTALLSKLDENEDEFMKGSTNMSSKGETHSEGDLIQNENDSARTKGHTTTLGGQEDVLDIITNILQDNSTSYSKTDLDESDEDSREEEHDAAEMTPDILLSNHSNSRTRLDVAYNKSIIQPRRDNEAHQNKHSYIPSSQTTANDTSLRRTTTLKDEPLQQRDKLDETLSTSNHHNNSRAVPRQLSRLIPTLPGVVSYNATLTDQETPPGRHPMENDNFQELPNNSASNKPISIKQPSHQRLKQKTATPVDDTHLHKINQSKLSPEIPRKPYLGNDEAMRKRILEVGQAAIEAGENMMKLEKSRANKENIYDIVGTRNVTSVSRYLMSIGKELLERGERTISKKPITPMHANSSGVHNLKHFRDQIPRNKPKKDTRLSSTGYHNSEKSHCFPGPVSHNVTLRGGTKSGLFTPRGPVKVNKDCTRRCCGDPKCDLALVINRECYFVHCYHWTLCQEVPFRASSIFNSEITQVRRHGVDHSIINESTNTTKPVKRVNLPQHSSKRNNSSKLNRTHNISVNKDSHQTTSTIPPKTLFREGNSITTMGTNGNNLNPKNVQQKRKPKNVQQKQKPKNVQQKRKPKNVQQRELRCRSFIGRDSAEHLEPGNWLLSGRTNSSKKCVDLCCSRKGCDVALQIGEFCYALACYQDNRGCNSLATPVGLSYLSLKRTKNTTVKKGSSARQELSRIPENDTRFGGRNVSQLSSKPRFDDSALSTVRDSAKFGSKPSFDNDSALSTVRVSAKLGSKPSFDNDSALSTVRVSAKLGNKPSFHNDSALSTVRVSAKLGSKPSFDNDSASSTVQVSEKSEPGLSIDKQTTMHDNISRAIDRKFPINEGSPSMKTKTARQRSSKVVHHGGYYHDNIINDNDDRDYVLDDDGDSGNDIRDDDDDDVKSEDDNIYGNDNNNNNDSPHLDKKDNVDASHDRSYPFVLVGPSFDKQTSTENKNSKFASGKQSLESELPKNITTPSRKSPGRESRGNGSQSEDVLGNKTVEKGDPESEIPFDDIERNSTALSLEKKKTSKNVKNISSNAPLKSNPHNTTVFSNKQNILSRISNRKENHHDISMAPDHSIKVGDETDNIDYIWNSSYKERLKPRVSVSDQNNITLEGIQSGIKNNSSQPQRQAIGENIAKDTKLSNKTKTTPVSKKLHDSFQLRPKDTLGDIIPVGETNPVAETGGIESKGKKAPLHSMTHVAKSKTISEKHVKQGRHPPESNKRGKGVHGDTISKPSLLEEGNSKTMRDDPKDDFPENTRKTQDLSQTSKDNKSMDWDIIFSDPQFSELNAEVPLKNVEFGNQETIEEEEEAEGSAREGWPFDIVASRPVTNIVEGNRIPFGRFGKEEMKKNTSGTSPSKIENVTMFRLKSNKGDLIPIPPEESRNFTHNLHLKKVISKPTPNRTIVTNGDHNGQSVSLGPSTERKNPMGLPDTEHIMSDRKLSGERSDDEDPYWIFTDDEDPGGQVDTSGTIEQGDKFEDGNADDGNMYSVNDVDNEVKDSPKTFHLSTDFRDRPISKTKNDASNVLKDISNSKSFKNSTYRKQNTTNGTTSYKNKYRDNKIVSGTDILSQNVKESPRKKGNETSRKEESFGERSVKAKHRDYGVNKGSQRTEETPKDMKSTHYDKDDRSSNRHYGRDDLSVFKEASKNRDKNYLWKTSEEGEEIPHHQEAKARKMESYNNKTLVMHDGDTGLVGIGKIPENIGGNSRWGKNEEGDEIPEQNKAKANRTEIKDNRTLVMHDEDAASAEIGKIPENRGGSSRWGKNEEGDDIPEQNKAKANRTEIKDNRTLVMHDEDAASAEIGKIPENRGGSSRWGKNEEGDDIPEQNKAKANRTEIKDNRTLVMHDEDAASVRIGKIPENRGGSSRWGKNEEGDEIPGQHEAKANRTESKDNRTFMMHDEDAASVRIGKIPENRGGSSRWGKNEEGDDIPGQNEAKSNRTESKDNRTFMMHNEDAASVRIGKIPENRGGSSRWGKNEEGDDIPGQNETESNRTESKDNRTFMMHNEDAASVRIGKIPENRGGSSRWGKNEEGDDIPEQNEAKANRTEIKDNRTFMMHDEDAASAEIGKIPENRGGSSRWGKNKEGDEIPRQKETESKSLSGGSLDDNNYDISMKPPVTERVKKRNHKFLSQEENGKQNKSSAHHKKPEMFELREKNEDRDKIPMQKDAWFSSDIITDSASNPKQPSVSQDSDQVVDDGKDDENYITNRKQMEPVVMRKDFDKKEKLSSTNPDNLDETEGLLNKIVFSGDDEFPTDNTPLPMQIKKKDFKNKNKYDDPKPVHITDKKIYKQGSDQNRHLRKSTPRIILPYLSGKSTAESNPSPTRVVPSHILSSKTLDKKTKKSTIPTEKDIDDMTSNDTIPVSNETEAKLSVDETGPDYFDLNDDYNMGTSEELKEIAKILKDGLLKPNITDERELKNNLKISEINTPKMEYVKGSASKLLSDSTSDNRLNSFSKNISGNSSHFPQALTYEKPFNLGNHGDNLQKRNEVVRTRAMKNNLAFGRLLKHFENILGMSRISNHNDLQHVEKLLNGLNRTVYAYARANGKKIQGRNSLSDTRHIEKLFGAVSKRMHVTDKNKVFKSLTAILSKLTKKLDKIHDNVAPYKKKTLVSGIKNFSSRAIRNGRLKITDMKKKIEELNKVFQKHLRNQKLDTCKRNALILDQLTLTDGLESKIYTKYDNFLDINQCIAQCCDASCDVALLMDQQCFTINCKRQKCVLAPNAHSRPTSTIALVNKDISANIGFTGIPRKENGFSQDKCQIQTHIIKNSILEESGLKGNATIVGHVTDSWSCGMTCCQHRTCNVAMVQRGACYVISCLTDGPCFDFQHASGQTVSLAFVRKSNSSRKLKLQPSMHLSSFQTQERPKKTEALPVTPSSTQKDQSSVALDHVSQRKSLVQEQTHPTLIFNHNILSKVPQSRMKIQSSKSFDVFHPSPSVHSSKKLPENPARRSHVTHLTKDNSSQCFETFPLVNVTLRGGFSAGDFKFQGQVSNDLVCVELCCNDSQCNVALMLRDVCYLVACKNNKLCQNVPLLPSAFETRLAYTARNSLEADLVKKELVPTLEQSKTTKKSQNFVQQRKANVSFRSNKGDACVTGFIASNSMFAEGFEAGVIISEGILKGGMNECISKCCNYKGCNATLLVQSRCFLVQCYSTKSCQIVQSDSPDLDSAIAIITREKHDQSLSFLPPEQRGPEVPSGTRRTRVFSAGEKSSELVSPGSFTPALKEEVPQVDNDLETTELLKELHSEVKRFMNAKNVSTNANTLPDELLGAFRNVYRRLNSTERHIADLSKNVDHSRNFKNNVSKQDSHDSSETLRTIPETNEKENSGLENKNHAAVIRESDVKNIVDDILAKKLKTHETNVQESHIASKISDHWNHSTMGDMKALLSKMEQLIVQQKQFNENIPKLPESLANLQRYLDFDARPNTSSKYEVKSHDVPSSIVHKKDPVLQDLQKSTVYKPLTSSNSLTNPAKNVPTPKLVNSPTLLVTSPSFIGSPDLKSTNHRAVTGTRDSFDERGKVLGKDTEDLSLGGLGLGKEIAEALKDAGIIPIKKEHSEEVKILSSSSISKISTKELKKEPSTKIREEQGLVANSMKTFKTNPKVGYSTVPPGQRLLNFLEKDVGMKPLVSKRLQKSSNGVPNSIEEFPERIHTSKISGHKGVNSELNQRINKLESMIINLRNHRNLQPSPNQHKHSSSANVLRRLKILEAAFKHYGSQTSDFLRNQEEKPNFVDVRKDLVQQLRGIVRSELSHHETNISPTVVLKSYHPENTKDLELGNNAIKRNEVKLTSHLDELYNHAVNEIKKALISIVPNKAQSVVASVSHSLPSHDKGDKNILLSNKDGDNIKSEKSISSGVPTSEDKFQKNTILPNDKDKPQTISASLNNKNKSLKVPDSLGYQAKPKMKSEFLDKATNSEKISAPLNKESKSQKNAGSVNEEWKVRGNEQSLGKSQNGVSSESKTLERMCHYSDIQNDVSLKGGIVREGVHDGGIVKDMNECLQRCCERDACNVAFMLSANCFLVPCKDRELCQTIELPIKTLNSRLAFVSRYDQAVTKLENFDRVVNAITLSPVPKPSSTSPVASISIPPRTQLQNKKFEKVMTPKLQVCPVGSIEYNMTLKGGMAAAHYKYAGKVADIDECVEHCCQLNNCDIAFTFSNECFLLTCKSIDLCESVPASSTELNPKMVRLLRHNADRHLPRKPPPDAVLKKVLTPTSRKASTKRKSEKRPKATRKDCLKSDAILHVVPKEGKKAGDYKDFGKVTSLEECVEHCCAWGQCNMAFMVLNGCFGISCTNHCQVVPSDDLTFESKVVYVKRRQEVLYWLTSQSNTRSALPGTPDNSKTEMGKPFSLSNVDRAKDVIPAQQQLTPSHQNPTPPAPSPKPPSSISEKTTNSKDKRGDGIKPQINVQAAVEPKTSARTGDKNAQCIVGDIEYDVTLGGGIKAGLYTEQGEVGDMMNCVDLCCKQRKCNVAMVIKDICYTVACYDPHKCASVPVRRIQYHPRLVHVKRLKEVKQRDQGDPRGHLRTSSIKDGSSENDEVSKLESENSNIEDELVDVLDDLNSGDPNGHKEKNRIITGHKGASVNTGDEHKQQVSSEITEIPKLNKVMHADSNEDPMDLKPYQARRPMEALAGSASGVVDPTSCLHSPISYNVTLRHGMRSGYFKTQGRVDNFETCFQRCCQDQDCNLVYLLRHYCYLVTCFDEGSCALAPLVSTNEELVIAFVHKKRRKEFMTQPSSLPANYQTFIPNHEPDIIKENQISLQDQGFSSNDQQPIPIQQQSLHSYGNNQPNIYPLPKSDSEVNLAQSFETNQPPPSSSSPSYMSPQCVAGPDRYFVTLRGGMNSGNFDDVGRVASMDVCKRHCCDKSDCDVAFMLQDRCFLVSCQSRELCDDVHASSSRYVTRISHMSRGKRSAPFTNDQRDTGLRGDGDSQGRWGTMNEKKDDIPNGHKNKGDTSLQPDQPSQEDLSKDMDLLEDMMKQTATTRGSRKDELSSSGTERAESKTPDLTNTGFDGLVNGHKHDPLVYDEVAGRRQHGLKGEDLGNMAADILKNIVKHRADDSVDAVLSDSPDPLAREVSKMKGKPDNDEKDFLNFQKQRTHSHPSDGISKNPMVQQESPAGREGNNGGTSDESKLVQSLLLLMNEKARMDKEKDDRDKQRNTETQDSVLDDILAGTVNSGPELQSKQAPSDDETMVGDKTAPTNDNFDYTDDGADGNDNFDVYDNHAKEVPRISQKQKKNPTLPRITDQTYPTVYSPDNELYNKVSPGEEIDDTQTEGQRESKQENSLEAGNSNPKNLNNWQLHNTEHNTEDIGNNADYYGDNGDDYNSEDQFDDNADLQNSLDDYEDQEDPGGLDYNDVIGGKRRLHNNSLRPQTLRKEKEPSPSGNENLVMNELGKIENELSNMKNDRFPEDRAQGKKKSKENNSNSLKKAKEKGKEDEKEDINDILHSLEELEKSKKLLNDIKDKGQKKSSQKPGVVKKKPSDSSPNATDENTIFRELNDIKAGIENMTKGSEKDKKVEKLSTADDVGEDISDILDEEDWDPDKRSDIAYPQSRTKPEHKAKPGSSSGNSRMTLPENSFSGNQLIEEQESPNLGEEASSDSFTEVNDPSGTRKSSETATSELQMPQLEPVLPLDPVSIDKENAIVERSGIPKPVKMFSENSLNIPSLSVFNSMPSLGEPEVRGDLKNKQKEQDKFSKTSTQKNPGNPFIPVSQDKDDTQSSLTAPASIVLDADRQQSQERQLKSTIPFPAHSGVEQPSSQDIRDMLEFSEHKSELSNSENKQSNTAKTSNLLVHLNFENSSGLTVFDNSGSGNDGRLQGAIIISPRYGKCGSAAVFLGGRILFDSKSFKRKPKTAVTVALWVKLNRISGTFSLFSVQRDSSSQGGKLELKVTAGIVQWTHINENQKVVFDIDSGPSPVVTAGQWTHVAATYDAYIFSTKLVVDVRLVNEKEGNGLLSQQWLGEIGVALVEGVHGNVDEFYMFDRALSTPEIVDLQHKCDVPLGRTNASTSKSNPVKTHISKNKNIQEASNIPGFNTSFNGSQDITCSQGTFHVSTTLEGGRSAGRFDYKGRISDVVECLRQCCNVRDCDLAYMVRGYCYAVHCKDKEVCKPVPAIESVGASSVLYVSRKNESNTTSGKSQKTKKAPVLKEKTKAKHRDTSYEKAKNIFDKASAVGETIGRGECRAETVFYNVDLKGGLAANSFKRHSGVTTMETCLGYCCQLGDCEVAMIKDGDCFSVHCSTNAMCEVTEGAGKLARVWRQKSDNSLNGASKLPASYKGKALVLYFGFHDISKNVVNDGSGRNNNARLTKGAKIMKYSRHGPGLDLTKGGLVLDGVYFRGKPKEGISIATWVKVSNIDGSHVIFHSTSKGDILTKTTILLEIQDGRIHWSYHNEIGEVVFTVISPPDIQEDTWNHVVVTYDSISQKAKVLVNGKVKAVGRGHGLLSDQWGDSTYFGTISEKTPFSGFLDEIYMFKRPLTRTEVEQYLKNMDNRNLGLNNVSKNGSIDDGKDFPSLSSSSSKVSHSVKHHDEVKPTNHSAFNRQLNSRNRTSNETKDQNFTALFSELTQATARENATCMANGSIYHKWTFRGGLKAGKFARIADVTSLVDCVTKCCDVEACDVAIMKGSTCFSLTCKNKKLCELRPAKLGTFDLTIAFVKRTSVWPSNQGNDVTTIHRDQTCKAGIRIVNVTINAGVGAGEVLQYRNITNIDDCVDQCCRVPKCNTAFLILKTCYAISCVIRDFCKVRPPPSSSGFHSEVVYVNKSGISLFSNPQNALLLPVKVINKVNRTTHNATPRTEKNKTLHFTTPLKPQSECRIGKIFKNVRLDGDLSAGVFVDHGLVNGMKDCILKCCSDPLCNVTYLIDKKCYSVRCHNKKLCRIAPALPMSLSLTIAYIRQHGVTAPHIRETEIKNKKNDAHMKNLLNAIKKLLRHKPHKPTTKIVTAPKHKLKQKNKSKHLVKLKIPLKKHRQKSVKQTKHRRLHHLKMKGDHRKHKNMKHKNQKPNIKSSKKVSRLYNQKKNPEKVEMTQNITKKDTFHCTKKFGCQHGCAYLPEIGYQCLCPPGLKLNGDGRTCQKKQDCFFGWHRCQQSCVQYHDRFRCECFSGYTLNSDGRHCDDINECFLEIGKCNQKCHNLQGSYSCSCKNGYVLRMDNVTCDDAHIAFRKSHLNSNVLTAPVEVAVQFSEIRTLQGQRAILNCRARGIPAPTMKWASGGDGASPIPVNGRFKVTPANSLIIDSTNFTDGGTYYCIASNVLESKSESVKLVVIDRNECEEKKNQVCEQHCHNTKGSYHCSCHHGYRLHDDSHRCEDINECKSSNHSCSHACNNTMGSFVCTCPLGYQLIHDDHTCSDIDECSTSLHGCSQLCKNTFGSYRCACVPGYKLSADQKNCKIEPTISKKVKPSSISKAVGVLVAMLTISVLSVGAIALLLGGFYRGRGNIELDDEMDEENTSKDKNKTVLFSWLD